MNFATIPAATYELGWRFTNSLSKEAIDSLSEFIPFTEPMLWSPERKATLAEFKIAAEAISLAEIIGNIDDLPDDISTLKALCDLVDDRLAANGLRLPSEDEFEAACGGGLFAWGTTIPDGIPYGLETSFEEHQKPNAHGLTLNSDPYRTELVRCALKLGDGGASICGGSPWPVAWFTLSPCFHLLDDYIETCFTETLEATDVRPVKR
jgi:hypothetical protein